MILVKPILNRTGFDCGDNDRFGIIKFEKKYFLQIAKNQHR